MYESKKKYFYGTGRRKSSVARVRVYENGTGSIIINGRDIDDYFGLETLKLIVRQPLVTTDMLGKVDIVVTVAGGGVSGQAGAIRHGISRALVAQNAELRPTLKAAGFMTRDPRMKERKKYGLKETKARIMMENRSDYAMELAVKGMLPKNTLGRNALTRLHLYKGEEHPHVAQKPEAWTL